MAEVAEPGDGTAAVNFMKDAPFEVIKALVGRLSPKCILRMRAVCRAWRDKLCMKNLLTRLNREEPPQPLLCFDRAACPAGGYIHHRDYRVESLDLRSGELRAASRFTANEDYFADVHDLKGGDAPPIEGDLVVDFERMENYGEADVKPQFTVHASLDGYLLVSFSSLGRWYVINPATRRWVSFFDPTTFGLEVVGFYEHRHSGSYRLLCLKRSNPATYELATTYTYYVVVVKPGERRHIGRPLSPAADRDHGLRFGVERASVSPPIQWKRGNMDLLWPPQQSQGYRMLVFDTNHEVFSWKRPPRGTMRHDHHMSLLEFPDDGSLGLSISMENVATIDLWRLEDYRNELWVLKHRVQLALYQMPALLRLRQGGRPWLPAVVSAEGDVLIESREGLFHCDRDGNFLRRIWFDQPQGSLRVLPVRHVLRRSFVQHPMFMPSQAQNAHEPPFFHWLGSDE